MSTSSSQQQQQQQQQLLLVAQQQKKKSTCLYRFRLNGIRSAKTIMSSTVDVVGDWTYYYTVKRLNNELLYKYYNYLWIFCIVSSVLNLLLLASIYCNFFHSPLMKVSSKQYSKFAPFGQCLKSTLGLQMIIEDAPQLILTFLITRDIGLLSPAAVFNFTTTGLNLLFNILNLLEIEHDGSISLNDNNDNDNYVSINNAENGRTNRQQTRKSTKDSLVVRDEVLKQYEQKQKQQQQYR